MSADGDATRDAALVGQSGATEGEASETTVVELPPKAAGAPLGIGLTESSSRGMVDLLLSPFVGDAETPQLVVAQVAPESPANGLLSPGDVILSINGLATNDKEGRMSAESASEYIRASTSIRLLVVPAAHVATGRREKSREMSPMRLALLGVLVLLALFAVGGILFGTVTPWLRVTEAESDAARWRQEAQQSISQGRQAQLHLRNKERTLVEQIQRLRHTAASNSAQANETMLALTREQANITAQRQEWRTRTRRWTQDVRAAQKKLREASSDREALQMQLTDTKKQLADAKRQIREVNAAMETARRESRDAMSAERERVRRIRQRLRQRAAELAAEVDTLGANGTVAALEPAPFFEPAARPPLISRPADDGWSSALVSAEIPLLELKPVNAYYQAGNKGAMQARPRYFSFVQVPAADVLGFLEGFERRVKTVDGELLLLFTRIGRFVEQYQTLLFCLLPANAKTASLPGGNASEYRHAAFVGWNPNKNQVTASSAISHNFGALYVTAAEARAAAVATATTGAAKTAKTAAWQQSSRLYGVGGQDQEKPYKDEERLGWSATHRRGLFMMNASRLTDVRFGGWFPYIRTDHIPRAPFVDGHQTGCMEKRVGFAPTCQFDGKLSMAFFRSRFFVYTRANLKAGGGGRFVQVARSQPGSEPPPAGAWLPFELLSIEGYDPEGPGNIYMASVKKNPFEDDMLVGLFAVNLGGKRESRPAAVDTRDPRRKGASRHDRVVGPYSGLNSANSDGRSFIGLALSCNGVDWSSLQEIAPTRGVEGRTYDQPVDGLLVKRGRVSVLIHRHVYEISPRAQKESRLVRRELNKAAMRRLAAQARVTLKGCALPLPDVPKSSNPYAAFD